MFVSVTRWDNAAPAIKPQPSNLWKKLEGELANPRLTGKQP